MPLRARRRAPLCPTSRSQANLGKLFAQARLRDYKTPAGTLSSWDRTGGNGDRGARSIRQSGDASRCEGAGLVTHLWFTINSQDPHAPEEPGLRAWWDGESSPSVEVPIGDFFGLGLGEYSPTSWRCLAVAPVKAMNAYFKMPFATARLTVTNEGNVRTDNLYFAVDYVTLRRASRRPRPVSTRNIARPRPAKVGPTTGATSMSRSQRSQEPERRRKLRLPRSRTARDILLGSPTPCCRIRTDGLGRETT